MKVQAQEQYQRQGKLNGLKKCGTKQLLESRVNTLMGEKKKNVAKES